MKNGDSPGLGPFRPRALTPEQEEAVRAFVRAQKGAPKMGKDAASINHITPDMEVRLRCLSLCDGNLLNAQDAYAWVTGEAGSCPAPERGEAGADVR